MGKRETKTAVAYLEQSERWVQVDSDGKPVGAPKEVDVVIKKISRNGFMITYLGSLVQMLDALGGKKMQVVKYILQNMDSNNKLSETTKEIAKNSGASRATVSETLRLLEKVGFIARKIGTVMLSPKIVHKGSAKKERYLLTKFNELHFGEKIVPVGSEDNV